jgi:hypothetical protein
MASGKPEEAQIWSMSQMKSGWQVERKKILWPPRWDRRHKAARARRFAAEMALQSYALRAAAEGAVLAYAEVTGETWKAYQAPVSASASVGRRATSEELAAFQTA